MEEKKNALTTRQWMLYRYLKSQYKRNEFISKEEISEHLPKLYGFDKSKDRNCRTLEQDIRKINESDEIQKIIVSSRFGYKIGNQEEVVKYINNRFNREFKNLKLDWKLVNKVKLNKQTRLTFQTQARDTIETFMTIED